MKRRGTSAGFSVIDAILAIVLVATAYVALGTVISGTAFQSAKCETGTTAIMLARQVMAGVRAQDWNSVASTGTMPFPSPFGGYSSAVTLSYFDVAYLDAAVAGPTHYKRIDVAVTFAGGTSTSHLYDLMVDLQ
jgi:Tfp pilus assembly protein PilV